MCLLILFLICVVGPLISIACLLQDSKGLLSLASPPSPPGLPPLVPGTFRVLSGAPFLWWWFYLCSSIMRNPLPSSPFSFSLHSSSCSSMGSRLALLVCNVCLGLPCGSDGKASAYSAGDLGSIPGSGNSPGEGNGYPLQYSCLENPMDGGAR